MKTGVVLSMLLILAVSTSAVAQLIPHVDSTTPVHNSMNFPVWDYVRINFNTSMNTATLNDTTIVVTGSLSGYHTGTVTYFAFSQTATFNPDVEFAEGEIVYVLVTTGVESVLGFPMSNNYAFNFTTEGGGGGTFPSSSAISIGNRDYSVYAGDYDNDGDLDLAVPSYNYDHVAVRLNNGDGSFASETISFPNDGPRDIYSADFDGDGYMDLVTANVFSDDISVLLNKRPSRSAWPKSSTAKPIRSFDLRLCKRFPHARHLWPTR